MRIKKRKSQQFIFTQIGTLSAASIGFLVATYIVGIDQINIFNRKWLWGDLFDTYLAWAQHNLDHCLECLTSDRLSFPLQMPLALFDPMPLFLVLLSWVSPLLPENSQYIGIYFIFCLTLQGIFGYLATGEAIKTTIDNPTWHIVIALLGASFFATIPLTFWRFQGHTALSSQWIIVLGLWLSLKFRNAKNGSWIIANTGVVFLASGINPYLTLMVIITPLCFILFDLLLRRISFWSATIRTMTIISICGIGLYIFGFTSATGINFHGGYGYYSMNILGPLDSNGKALLFQLDIPDATGGQTFEGFEYLGLGLLIAIMMTGVLSLRKKLFPIPTWLFPALLVVVGSYCLALSTNLTLSKSLIAEIPFPQQLSNLISSFRASGRLFWVGGFWLILITFALMIRSFSYRIAASILFALTIIQLIDVAGVASAVRVNIGNAERLHLTKEMQTLPSGYYNTLFILPPWQCGPNASPGGARGYEITGEFALKHNLKMNSFYAARILPEQSAYHCNLNNALSSKKPAKTDAIYILSKTLFSKYQDHLIKTHNCKFSSEHGGLFICWPWISQPIRNTQNLLIIPSLMLSKGFYSWEGGVGNFTWSSGDATLLLDNLNKAETNVQLDFEMNTLLTRKVIISVGDDKKNIEVFLNAGEKQLIKINLTLAPGRTYLQFKTDKPASLPGNGDIRNLAFSIANLDLQLID